jgi:transcriptional regulator with XRE-family HTH domain
MEKVKNIKELLGMKYDDMAMLLQVNRSQWAMYATGKRDLPTAAKLKLAEMLGFLQQSKKETFQNSEDKKKDDARIAQLLASKEVLNAKLQNIYKQKLKATEKKYKTAVTALQFINFLETNVQKPTAVYQLLLQTIKRNAETEIEKNGVVVQAEFQLKYEILKGEEKILNKKILNIV